MTEPSVDDLLKKMVLGLTKEKKKPHNITIKNNRPEPKVKPNIRYSAKQNYRRYKTNVEPKLHDKLLIDEEGDIVAKTKDEFNNRDKDLNNDFEKRTPNLNKVSSGGLPDYYRPAEFQNNDDEIFSEIGRAHV